MKVAHFPSTPKNPAPKYFFRDSLYFSSASKSAIYLDRPEIPYPVSSFFLIDSIVDHPCCISLEDVDVGSTGLQFLWSQLVMFTNGHKIIQS
jgi:hypothetical protein